MSLVTTKNREVALSSLAPLFEPRRCEVMAAVSEGLHQVAQPMTVLQGVLELALIAPCTEEQYKRALKRAIDQFQRVAASIDAVRQLLHARPCPLSGENFSTEISIEKTATAKSSRGCANV